MANTISFSDFQVLRLVNALAFLLFLSSSVFTSFVHYHGSRWAGGDFSYIWTATCFLSLGYVVYGWVDRSHAPVKAIGYRFALLALLSSVFLHTNSYRLAVAPFVIAVLLVLLAGHIYLLLARSHRSSSLEETLLVHLPFSVWFAWTLLALYVSLLTSFNRSWHTEAWTALLLAALALASVGFACMSRRGDIAAAATVSWFLCAVWESNSHHSHGHGHGWRDEDVLEVVSAVAAVVSLLGVAKCAYYTWVKGDGTVRLGDDGERDPLLARA